MRNSSGEPLASPTSSKTAPGRRPIFGCLRVPSLPRLIRGLGRLGVHAYIALAVVYILAPILVIVAVSFHHKRYIVFPFEEYSLRWWTEALVRPEWRSALWTSFLLAVQATLISTGVGIVAGLAIHHHDFRGRQFVSTFFLSPLLMPQLLTGLALLFFFAQLNISGTYGSLLMGHVLVSFPYVVRLVLAALPNVSRTIEEAAMTLGANEFRTLTHVTLPMISPAIRGGAMFAFMASYNNVLMSLFLSVARVTPMPIKIYQHLEWGADPTVAAISTLFLLLTIILLLILHRTVGIELMPSVEQRQG